jgi:AraC-like DNA-binding protein
MENRAVSSIGELRQRLLSDSYRQRSLVFPRRGGRLHAMPTSCGVQEARPPDYDWNGMNRGRAEFVVFQYTLDGCGQLDWEGREIPVPPGSAMLVRIPHPHRYRVLPEAGFWQFLYLCATGRDVLHATALLHEHSGPILPLSPDGSALTLATELFETACADRLTSPFRASALVYSLFMALLDETLAGGAETPQRHLTAPAVRHCREHLADRITVGTLAHLCGLSQWHFSRLFKAEQGLSPAAFLQVERVREAVRLLQDTDAPLKAIADQCGFLDANYLAKVFQHHMGTTPAAFRRSGV